MNNIRPPKDLKPLTEKEKDEACEKFLKKYTSNKVYKEKPFLF